MTLQEVLANTQRDGDCLRWLGSHSVGGYGVVSRPRRERGTRRAHRYVWELLNGAPTADEVVCHKCDVRDCVNPDHLFLGSAADNVRDCWSKGRHGPIPNARHLGVEHGRAKLTEAEVCHIRVATDGPSACGRRHQVTETLVRLIRQAKAWRHL